MKSKIIKAMTSPVVSPVVSMKDCTLRPSGRECQVGPVNVARKGKKPNECSEIGPDYQVEYYRKAWVNEVPGEARRH